MIRPAHPKLICFGFGNNEGSLTLLHTPTEKVGNSRTGTAKIAQSIVESNVTLGGAVNKTLICAEKEEIRMGGGIETLTVRSVVNKFLVNRQNSLIS